jgi:hypothetical protein
MEPTRTARTRRRVRRLVATAVVLGAALGLLAPSRAAAAPPPAPPDPSTSPPRVLIPVARPRPFVPTDGMVWGTAGDLPVPADYDGDGRTDVAVWRPSTGAWWIIESSTSWTRTQSWGVLGDVPVPADYDGDGRVDLAVWRPGTGEWFVIASSTGAGSATGWGQSGDVPIGADFDGDGRADPSVWRRSDSTWYFLLSSGPVRSLSWASGTWASFGGGTLCTACTPVAGDWELGGGVEPAFFGGVLWTVGTIDRPSADWTAPTGTPLFFRTCDASPSGTSGRTVTFANGVWSPSNFEIHVGGQQPVTFGQAGDVPVPGDYRSPAPGKPMERAVWRPGTGQWFFQPVGSACIN